MRRPNFGTTLLLLLGGLTISTTPLFAQGQEDEDEWVDLSEIDPQQGPGESSSQQDEMTQLFGKVERRLREIDALLDDAAAGDTSRLSEVGAAGIGDLIKLSQSSGRQVIEDIDRILEIASQSGGGT